MTLHCHQPTLKCTNQRLIRQWQRQRQRQSQRQRQNVIPQPPAHLKMHQSSFYDHLDYIDDDHHDPDDEYDD